MTARLLCSSDPKGWDAFDRLVAWALHTQPGTLADIMQVLEVGVPPHLVARTLEDFAKQGRAVVVDGRWRPVTKRCHLGRAA